MVFAQLAVSWKKILFYSLLKESRTRCDTVTVVFDMMQNQPLPKINVTEQYYCRQLWLYTLGIVIHTSNHQQKPHNVHLYTWTEIESGKGSNEIASALCHFLSSMKRRFLKRGYRQLHLFCDSCSGQNKNASMMAMLLSYVNSKANPFQEVKVVFPIRGHSYLPADRVFGRLEKEYRRQEVMKTPNSYYEIMKLHGRVHKICTDWNVFNYKKLADQIFKKGLIKVQQTRIWKFKKNLQSIECQTTYFGPLIQYNILKRNVPRVPCCKPTVCRYETHLSEEKREDVMKLLSFVLLNPDEEEFYAQALQTTATRKPKKCQRGNRPTMKL